MEAEVAVNKKSDGLAGRPIILTNPDKQLEPMNTPGAQNAALKEAPPKTGEGVDPNHPCRGRCEIIDAERGTVREFCPDGRPRRNIAICGFASSTRGYIIELAKDPTWSIWGLNQLYRHIPRADRWFDIHHNWDREIVPGTDHRQWARECGIPFYHQTRQADVPTSVRYPLDAVLGIYGADYFTSSIPYMLALALMEIDADVAGRMRAFVAKTPKMKLAALDLQDVLRRFYGDYTIGIFGIDLVVGGEYFHEKPCAEFWVGTMAVGRGINVKIPPESALCKQGFRYGYDPESKQLLRREEVTTHRVGITAERDELLKRLYMAEGAIAADNRWEEVLDLRARGAQVG